MDKKSSTYLLYVVLHILLGVGVYFFTPISKVYGVLIFLFGIYFVVKNKNANNEVLMVAAYIVGSEVFLRMTDGNPNYEFTKYSVIVFVLMGMFYSGFSKNAIPYWLFLVLLIPGLLIGVQSLDIHRLNIRNLIAFNMSGPICLGLTSIYCFNRRIQFSQINKLLMYMLLPIISTTAYLILYTPDLREVVTGTGSNMDTSGGFGPNQVSTILGLGVFILFTRIVFLSKNKLILLLNIFLIVNVAYRGLITFSRGGMITGGVLILVLIVFIYLNINKTGKYKLSLMLFFVVFGLLFTWFYTEQQTGGLIGKRYANKDAVGRKKESSFSGREVIAEHEIESFIKNPIFGIGVAKGTEERMEIFGETIASHNEITRMLGEHGLFGLFGLLILFVTPFVLYLNNKKYLYLFCFVAFWLLTINHAAMRTASPAFIYALSLLKVKLDEA